MRALLARSARLLRRWSTALLVGCLVGSGASPGWAAGSAAESGALALSLGQQGATAYESGNYVQAIEHFDRAFALLPAPSLQLWAARSCAKLGRVLEAQQRYRQTTRLSTEVGDPVVQRQARAEAERELEQLGAHIPLLGVRVLGTAGQPARLTLDERSFDSAPGQLTPVDPGHHVLLGSYQGQQLSLSVDLALGERRELIVEFTPAAASERAPAASDATSAPPMTPASSAKAWRTAGMMGIGAGAALLLTGIVTRSVAQERYDSLRRLPGCSRTQCTPEARDSVERYRSMRSVSLVTAIGGAVLGGAGAGVLLFAPKEEEAGLTLLPGGVAWSGRF